MSADTSLAADRTRDQPGSGTGETVARDPDAIQREIEATRAELADTIDAIAEKMSPKRAASRTMSTVKGKVDELRSGIVAGASGSGPRATGGSGGSTILGGGDGTVYQVRRALRTDRVAVLGAAATLAAMFVVVRRRRARRSSSKPVRLRRR